MNERVRRIREDQGGFTLIELLIVIIILGILAGIVVFSVGAISKRGDAAACQSDLKTVTVAVESYRAKNGSYPADLDPTLTVGANQFLRPDPSITGDLLKKTRYWIVYDPTSGAVDSTQPSAGGTALDCATL